MNLSESICSVVRIENGPLLLPFESLVLEHTWIQTNIFALDIEGRLWRFRVSNIMIVTVRTVLVTVPLISQRTRNVRDRSRPFLEFLGIFAETFLALLAGKRLGS